MFHIIRRPCALGSFRSLRRSLTCIYSFTNILGILNSGIRGGLDIADSCVISTERERREQEEREAEERTQQELERERKATVSERTITSRHRLPG